MDALRLPLSVLQKVCLRMPHEMTRGNVVGAFLPSSLGVSTRVARPSDLRLLHERVAEVGCVKLCDFGLATTMQTSLTKSVDRGEAAFQGSLPWMSPQQLQAKR